MMEITEQLTGYGATIDQKDNDGFTPLMVAAQNGHIYEADLLYQKGAD